MEECDHIKRPSMVVRFSQSKFGTSSTLIRSVLSLSTIPIGRRHVIQVVCNSKPTHHEVYVDGSRSRHGHHDGSINQ